MVLKVIKGTHTMVLKVIKGTHTIHILLGQIVLTEKPTLASQIVQASGTKATTQTLMSMVAQTQPSTNGLIWLVLFR